MSKTITITGNGSLKASPDLILLQLDIETEEKDYASCLEKATEKNNKLSHSIQNIGISKKEIKTANFSINPEYESYRDENDNWHERFKGYRCFQTLKISLDLNFEFLGKIINEIALSEVNPRLGISFSMRDVSTLKDELLLRAAASARHNAELLCQATDKKLGEIININFSEVTVNFVSDTSFMNREAVSMKAMAASLDITPEDIEIEENVNFTWELI